MKRTFITILLTIRVQEIMNSSFSLFWLKKKITAEKIKTTIINGAKITKNLFIKHFPLYLKLEDKKTANKNNEAYFTLRAQHPLH